MRQLLSFRIHGVIILLFCAIVSSPLLSAPSVFLTGIFGTTPSPGDGFSFVALEDIAPGTVIYFTNNHYNDVTNNFSSGEIVASYTSQGLSCGDVVSVTEQSSNNDMVDVTCTSGVNCGIISLISGTWEVNNMDDAIFLYSDSDTDPTNGITEIYSAVSILAFGANENPASDFPDAMVINSLQGGTIGSKQFDVTLRNSSINKASLEDPANWAFNANSIVPFTNLSECSVLTQPIPTMSEWGMLITALLLLIFGIIALRSISFLQLHLK